MKIEKRMNPFFVFVKHYEKISIVHYLSDLIHTVMPPTRHTHILEYLSKIKSASKEATKKEIFKDLLNRLYHESPDILKMVDKITAGAERTVLNIKLEDKSKKGRADSYFNNVIIEFENSLKTSEKHAKEQLAEYLSGSFHSGEGYNFTLIVSDFVDWKVFAPSLTSIERLGELDAHDIELVEVPHTHFTVTDKNTDDFYYWLDRFLFKENKQQATLSRIQTDFGEWSQTFIESIQILSLHFNAAKQYGEVKVAREQWKRFLSIAYGEFNDDDEKTYLVHIYLSIFSKMLAYSVLANKQYIDDEDIHDIMRGSIFERLNVKNFIDHDFYYWVANDTSFKQLKKVFRRIAQQISLYDFTNVSEDVLKVKADGNYLDVYCKGEKYIIRETLKSFSE
jgi:hypothetical protein